VLEKGDSYVLECKETVFKTDIVIYRDVADYIDVFYATDNGMYVPFSAPILTSADNSIFLRCAGLKAQYNLYVVAYDKPKIHVSYDVWNPRYKQIKLYVNGNLVDSLYDGTSWDRHYTVPFGATFGVEAPYSLDGEGTDLSFENKSVRVEEVLFNATHNGAVNLVYMCFVYGTQITLADGTTKSVEDITYSDKLLVWDFDNGCFSSAFPLWILAESTAPRYYHLSFDDGSTLNVIVDHRGLGHRLFCLDTNRFEYSHTCVGKSIVTKNGVVKMVSCDIVEDAVKYYNIITDYHMNLYANDILTSTGLNNLYPVKDMHFAKEERTPIPISALKECPEKYYHGLRLGEQVDYTIERLNEKIEVLKNGAIENRNKPSCGCL
jgi:hypothetical protein